MMKIVLGILMLSLITVFIGFGEAYAAPDCTTPSKKYTLGNKEMYLGSENGTLHKIDVTDAKTCKVAPMIYLGTIPVVCTDLALDGTDLTTIYGNARLYCVTFTDLYEIDRGTGVATFIGNLVDIGDGPMDVPINVFDMNGMEIDFGGLAYAISDSGKLYRVDLGSGDLTLQKDFAQQSSGDLAWDTISGNLFWTTNTCPGCPAGEDGLYEIDLSVFPPTSTFLGSVGFNNVFAADFVNASPNIFYVNNGGRLIETQTDADPVDDVLSTPRVRTFGGTANEALVGGINQAINQINLLINGLESIPVWLTSGAIGGENTLVALPRN